MLGKVPSKQLPLPRPHHPATGKSTLTARKRAVPQEDPLSQKREHHSCLTMFFKLSLLFEVDLKTTTILVVCLEKHHVPKENGRGQ